MHPIAWRWSAHTVTRLVAHIVWTTRHRTPTLPAEKDAELALELKASVREMSCELVAVGNASDHVHGVVAYRPSLSLSDIVRSLKGASSRRVGSTSQVGYWAESITPDDIECLAQYILGQRAHHKNGPTPEAWERSSHHIDRRSPPAAGFTPRKPGAPGFSQLQPGGRQ